MPWEFYALAIRRGGTPFYYASTDNGQSVWVPYSNAAKKFRTEKEAETFALLLTTKEHELIGHVEVRCEDRLARPWLLPVKKQ